MRVSYARLLVEMDVTEQLPDSVMIEDPNGVVIEQKVVYDWKPSFCQKWFDVGHDCNIPWRPDTRPKLKAPPPRVAKKWVPKRGTDQPKSSTSQLVQPVQPTEENIVTQVIPSDSDSIHTPIIDRRGEYLESGY